MRNDARVPGVWISTTEYGDRYGIDPRTVRKWLEAGIIASYRVGKTIRVLNQSPSEQAKGESV